MRLMAVSISGLDLSSPESFSRTLKNQVSKAKHPRLVLLPGFIAPAVSIASGKMPQPAEPGELVHQVKRNFHAWREWESEFQGLLGEVAGDLKAYVVGGSTLELEKDRVYITSNLWDYKGGFLGKQRQLHLHREELKAGFSRGEVTGTFPVDHMNLGIMVGNDAWHPETGRILALQGADVVAAPVHVWGGYSRWLPVAGLWSQVQQNQFWGLESWSVTSCDGSYYGGECAVLAPCETSPGKTGYLERGEAGREFASGHLDEEKRHKLLEDYPLLGLLNPGAYRGNLPELYRHRGSNE